MELTQQQIPKTLEGGVLPTVGIECEYFHKPRGLWVRFIPLLITTKETSPNGIPSIYGEWYHPEDCMWEPDLIDDIENTKFRKLETTEQKEARVREESAYELYCAWVGDFIGTSPCTFNEFQEDKQHLKRKWLRVVDKSGYRKDDNNG